MGSPRNGEPSASLGIVWGRRRIGKSFMLQGLADQTNGFSYHAVRGSSAEALRDLGEQLGKHQGQVAPLARGCITIRHVQRLEDARAALGPRAGGAKLLVFGQSFDDTVRTAATERADLEVVDLERLYSGSRA